MRIGLNLLYLIPGIVGGTETYAKGLLRGLKQIKSDYEFVLFVNRESAGLIADDNTFRKVVCPVNAVNREKRYYFEQLMLRRYVEEYKINLLHSLAYTSPLFFPCPTLVSIPDLNFKAFGSTFQWSRRLMLRLIVRQAVLRSNKVITISNFSREEILKQYHIPPEKIVVTYLAADDEVEEKIGEESITVPGLPDLHQPYAVAFSSTTANKNIPRLIKAFLEAKKNHKLVQRLILVGHQYPVEEHFRKCCAGGDVLWSGYLNRRVVLKILKHADFMIYPSFYEGFGLPVLEAMVAGVPIVCSNAASIPEVVGDAGIFFDPLSIQDMAARIALVADDQALRQDLRQKGFKNLKRFSWKQTATQTKAVYDGILQNRTSSDPKSDTLRI